MKTLYQFILAFIFCGLIFVSCNNDDDNKNGNNIPDQLVFSGKLKSNSGCKENLKSTDTRSYPDTLSCVEYSFDESTNTMTLRHINAGFNCCQDSIYCLTDLRNDTITINEIEENPYCKCRCLFDLTIELHGIEAKEYYIKYKEPYADDYNELAFPCNLSENNEGKFYVIRKYYPWINSH